MDHERGHHEGPHHGTRQIEHIRRVQWNVTQTLGVTRTCLLRERGSTRRQTTLSPHEAVDFVREHGIVLQAAHGPVPSLAEAVAGERIRGSWWGHPQGRAIFHAAQVACESRDILVCKLIDGKITFVHRRLWPALVKLGSRFAKRQLAKTWNEHTATGAHRARRQPFPDWVPPDVRAEAQRMSVPQAERIMGPWLGFALAKSRPGARVRGASTGSSGRGPHRLPEDRHRDSRQPGRHKGVARTR